MRRCCRGVVHFGSLGPGAQVRRRSVRHHSGLRPRLGLQYALPALAITAVLWRGDIALVIDPTKRRAYRLFHV